MIDLHTHVLPGLDDGAQSIEDSLALARAAHDAGTSLLVATPHVREDYPFDLGRIGEGVEALNDLLRAEAIPVEIAASGEVSITRVIELETSELRRAQLNEGPYLLVESPYNHTGGLLEQALFEAQLKGFRPILAHPERSPCFLGDLPRLTTLVERGVLCSVTAGSMEGSFGGTIRDFVASLFEAGLVHDVASDAHGVHSRAPNLSRGFERLEEQMPGLGRQAHWYAREAPAAILAGMDLPPRPDLVRRSKSGLRAFRTLRRMLG